MSVRKRVWKTASGKLCEAWLVDYRDTKGVRRFKNFSRKKDADSYAAKTSVGVMDGTHVADSASVTVKAAGELWINSAEAEKLERTSINQYRQHLDLHIVPFLGTTKLSQLNVPTVRGFADKLRAEGRSSAMVKKVWGSLGSLLADAQERGLIVRNPVREMRRRHRRNKQDRQKEHHNRKLQPGIDFPDTDEIRLIVNSVTGRWRPLLLTAIFAGLRASEIRGLRWSDVNLKDSELHVRQRADCFNAIGKTKSEAGERTLPLPPIAVNALREWKLRYPKPIIGRDKKGRPILQEHKPEHFVFPNGKGNVESHANIVNRGLHPALISAGVTVRATDAKGEPVLDKEGNSVVKPKYTGMHALRHFYASWCINRKQDGGLELPLKNVQARLGHSSITMTADVYGHLFKPQDDAAALAAAENRLLAVHAT